MKIRRMLGYTAVTGGLVSLLLASSSNKVPAQDLKSSRLNQYLELMDYNKFNEEVTSEVRPLINEVIKIMRDNGYCNEFKAGSDTNSFLAGEPRIEEHCNSFGVHSGLPNLFGDEVTVYYDKTKILGSGEEYHVVETRGPGMYSSISDWGANGLRINEPDRYNFGELTSVRPSQAADLLTRFNDVYKSLLKKIISYSRRFE